MQKLIVRDLFMYLGKSLLLLPLYALLILYMMQVFGIDTGFSFAIIMVSLISFMITAQYTFNCDEMSKFNRFLRATPVSSKTIVLSRYASCLLSAAMSVVLVFVLGILKNALSAFFPSLRVNISVKLDAFIVCIIILALISSLILPLLFQFSYTKTKYVLMLFLIAFGSSAPIWVTDSANERLIKVLSYVSNSGYLAIAACSLIILYGSTKISIAIFNKKEV